MPSVEPHHRVNGTDTGRNSRGRRIKKSEAQVFALNNLPVLGFLMSFQIQGTFGPLRERKTIH